MLVLDAGSMARELTLRKPRVGRPLAMRASLTSAMTPPMRGDDMLVPLMGTKEPFQYVLILVSVCSWMFGGNLRVVQSLACKIRITTAVRVV